MNKMILALLAALIAAVPLNSYAESPLESLSPELSALLKQEMVAIQGGMQNIVPAFAAGDFGTVSEIAGKIKNSFILKQKMSDEQRHELHEKLPPGFIAKDQQFHRYAGMLEHVSEKKNTELVSFYYSKMLESCIACHSEYAAHRFPDLNTKAEKEEHHHH